MAKFEVPVRVVFDRDDLQRIMYEAKEEILNNESIIIELVERHYGSGKAQAVSDLLNEDN